MGKRFRGYVGYYGISFGSALAMLLSYVEHKSIFWAVIHGILSWIYVVYFIIFYRLI